MSPEEWALEFRRLIEDAESDGMHFYVEGGDFMISAHPWRPEDNQGGVFIW